MDDQYSGYGEDADDYRLSGDSRRYARQRSEGTSRYRADSSRYRSGAGSSAGSRGDSDRYSTDSGRYSARSARHAGAADGESRAQRRAVARGSDGYTPRTRRSDAASSARRTQRATQRESVQSEAASDYSRQRYADRLNAGNASRRYAQKAKRGRIVKIALISVAAVLLIAAIGVFAYLHIINSNLQQGVTQDLRNELVATDMANEPFYILLMGTDGSQQRVEEEDYGDAWRSDSTMLVRVDPVNKKVTMVSIHRDTMVDLGEYGMQKLNAAHALGGPALAVKTVSELAGVDISHYAEINFDGFEELVDALGGVEVDVPVEIDDYDAGGYVAAGPQTLNGEDALILCRARNTYNDISGDPDKMRAANQRLVLSAIAKKVLKSDLATIANSVRTMSEFVTTDMSVNDIIGIAQVMQGLDPDTDIYSAMQPTVGQLIDGVWYEATDTEEWNTMMTRVKSGLPPYEDAIIDESTGIVLATSGTGPIDTSGKDMRISVRNGSPTPGLAQEVAAFMQKKGYTDVVFGNASSSDYEETMIVYRSTSLEYKASVLRDILGQGELYCDEGLEYTYDGSVLVLIGADWVPPAPDVYAAMGREVAAFIDRVEAAA